MIIHRTSRIRGGVTLIELVLSIGTASILLVGLSSAVFVAVRASDPSLSAAPAAIDSHSRLTNMFSELQTALSILEQAPAAITVTLPDRDADTNPETIRYAWSGTAGDPLTRNFNSAPTDSVVTENVHDFSIEYYQPATAVEYVQITLQIGTDAQASLRTNVPMLNEP